MTVELEKAQEAKKLPVTDDIREAMALVRRGTDTFLIEEEFEQKLARSKMTGEPTSTSATRSCSTSCASFRTSATR